MSGKRYKTQAQENRVSASFNIAMRCANSGYPAEMRAEAFRVLAVMTDDANSEQVFIDYLVEENNSYSALRQ